MNTSRRELAVPEPWQEGRLNARARRRNLLFGRVYEDHAIERRAFSGRGRLFCIASAGCTALALCDEHEVVACDINPAQIEYVRRRLEGGGLETGSAERIMAFMRLFMPLAGWRRAKLEHFLNLDSPSTQLAFWHDELDTWRFRAGLGLFLSPLWLGRAYSSALLSSLPARFDQVLRGRLQRCFARHSNRDNPYARPLLLGSNPLEHDNAPAARAASNGRLELVADDAAAYLERCPAASFDGFSLSNILDGARPAYADRLQSALRRAARPGAVVVSRSFGEPPESPKNNLAEDDRSMLWGIVDVQPVEAFESPSALARKTTS